MGDVTYTPICLVTFRHAPAGDGFTGVDHSRGGAHLTTATIGFVILGGAVLGNNGYPDIYPYISGSYASELHVENVTYVARDVTGDAASGEAVVGNSVHLCYAIVRVTVAKDPAGRTAHATTVGNQVCGVTVTGDGHEREIGTVSGHTEALHVAAHSVHLHGHRVISGGPQVTYGTAYGGNVIRAMSDVAITFSNGGSNAHVAFGHGKGPLRVTSFGVFNGGGHEDAIALARNYRRFLRFFYHACNCGKFTYVIFHYVHVTLCHFCHGRRDRVTTLLHYHHKGHGQCKGILGFDREFDKWPDFHVVFHMGLILSEGFSVFSGNACSFCGMAMLGNGIAVICSVRRRIRLITKHGIHGGGIYAICEYHALVHGCAIVRIYRINEINGAAIRDGEDKKVGPVFHHALFGHYFRIGHATNGDSVHFSVTHGWDMDETYGRTYTRHRERGTYCGFLFRGFCLLGVVWAYGRGQPAIYILRYRQLVLSA